MKKNCLVLCGLIAVGFLCACGAPSDAVGAVTSAPVPSVSAQTAAPGKTETITYTVEQTIQEDDTAAEDGTILAKYHYELPTLRAFGTGGAELTQAKTDAEQRALDAAATFNRQFQKWAADTDFNEVADWAKEAFAQNPELFRDSSGFYDLELTYTSWQTDHLVSIQGQYYSNTGGAHPNTVLMAWNFDLDAGAFLEPTSLADDAQAFSSAVTAEIIRQADANAAQQGLDPTSAYWENYQEVAADWPSYAVSFDKSGMTVRFSQYEMACYAAGPQTFTIPNSFLASYLSEYGRTLLDIS